MRSPITILAILVMLGSTAFGKPVPTTDSIPLPNRGELPVLVALRYGLVVNDTLDQREDEEASTRAAQQYLNDLYAMFGDWDLAYCAFLYGPTYVRSLQHRGLEMAPPEKPVIRKTTPSPKPAPPKVTPTPSQPRCITYIVKRGDTLSSIAKRYNVKVSDIKKWNNLKSDLIRENQKLKIYP